MKNIIHLSSHPTFASVKTAGRDGQTAGGHHASGVFLSNWKARETAPPKGARRRHSNETRRTPIFDCPYWPECQCPDESTRQECPTILERLPIDMDFSLLEEPNTPPWWLAVMFLAVGLFSVFWILKVAVYFGGRILAMVGV